MACKVALLNSTCPAKCSFSVCMISCVVQILCSRHHGRYLQIRAADRCPHA